MEKHSHEYQTASPDRYGILKAFANDNKRGMTTAEQLLWEELRGKKLGVKFRRQHPIFDYIADFVCLERKLIIEVDGGYHNLPEQFLDDDSRTRNIQAMGFRVIRLTNEEVMFDMDNVVDRIYDVLENI